MNTAGESSSHELVAEDGSIPADQLTLIELGPGAHRRTFFIVRIIEEDGKPPWGGELISEAVFAMADELGDLEGITDPCVEANLEKGEIEFSLGIADAEDELEAIENALVAIRCAIHEVGGKAPDWPARFSVVSATTELVEA